MRPPTRTEIYLLYFALVFTVTDGITVSFDGAKNSKFIRDMCFPKVSQGALFAHLNIFIDLKWSKHGHVN